MQQKLSQRGGWPADLSVIFGICTLTLLLALRGGDLAIGGDYVLPFHPFDWLTRILSAWNPWVDGGVPVDPVLAYGSTPEALGLSFLEGVGIPLPIAQRMFLVSMYWVGSSGVYLLIRTLMKGVSTARIMGLFGGFAYLWTPVLVEDTVKQIASGNLVPRVALPLFLALFVRGLQKRDMKYAIGLSFLSFPLLGSFPAYDPFLLAAAFALMYLAFFILFETMKSTPRVYFAFKFVLTATILSVIVNLYWLIPLIVSYPILSSAASTPIVFLDTKYTTMLNVVRLIGLWTFFSAEHVPYSGVYQTSPLLLFLTFLIPILAFSSVLLRPRNRHLLFVAISTLPILFLAKGANPPLDWVFPMLVSNIFLFRLIPNSWGYTTLLVIQYSLLMGVACGDLVGRLRKLDIGFLVERETSVQLQ